MHSLRRDRVEEFHTLHHTPDLSGQMICFNCEEIVSRSAQTCPYCRIKLLGEPVGSSSEPSRHSKDINKITPLQPSSVSQAPPHLLRPTQTISPENPYQNLGQSHTSPPWDSQHDETKEDDRIMASFSYMGALLFFLLGGALFFFGIAIPLFAQDGVMVLAWDESLWLPFIGCGLALIASGYLFLHRIERSFHDD